MKMIPMPVEISDYEFEELRELVLKILDRMEELAGRTKIEVQYDKFFQPYYTTEYPGVNYEFIDTNQTTN